MNPLLELMAGSGQWAFTGAQIISFNSSSSTNDQTGITFKTDGKAYKYENGVETEMFDWIVPTSSYDALYEIRIIDVVWTLGSAFETEAAAENTWIAMSANRSWYVVDSNPTGGGAQDMSCKFEIRYNGGATLDTSGTFNFTSDYEV